jgi:hypothetical protein
MDKSWDERHDAKSVNGNLKNLPGSVVSAGFEPIQPGEIILAHSGIHHPTGSRRNVVVLRGIRPVLSHTRSDASRRP